MSIENGRKNLGAKKTWEKNLGEKTWVPGTRESTQNVRVSSSNFEL